MENIIVLLVLVSIIGLLVGIFSPEKSLFWWSGEKTRIRSAQIYLSSFLAAFILFAVFMSKSKIQPETAKNAPDTTSKQVEKLTKEKVTDTSTIKMPESIKNLTKKIKESAKNQPQDNSANNSQNQMPYFEGVTATDIYLPFTNLGFSKKVQSFDNSVEYHLEQSTTDYQLFVDVVGVASDKIDRVRGTVLIYSGENDQTTTNFLAMVASVPYKNARPQEAYNWVLANIANQSSSITIGGISFTLMNNGTNKMLTIEPPM